MGQRAFSHSSESIHNEEIDLAADAALCRLLSHLLLKELYVDGFDDRPKAKSLPEEILRTCQLFEMVYHCSKAQITSSFQRLGPDLLRILCHIIMYEIENYKSSLPNPEFRDVHRSSYESEPPGSMTPRRDNNEDTCLQSVTRILFLFARVQSLTETIARHKNLISLCVSLLQYPIDVVSFEAQHNILFILANMACCRSVVLTLSSYDRLMDTVIHAALQNRETTVTHKTTWADYYQPLRFHCTAFRCLLNLSHPKENKVNMVEKDELLLSIAYTISMQTSRWVGVPQAIHDMAAQTRRFAMSTLRNIASAPTEQKYRLCTFSNGILLDSLYSAAQNVNDPVAKEKSFAVLFNLVCSDTAEILILHPHIMELLADAVTAPRPAPTNVGDGSRMELSDMPYQTLVSLSQSANHLSNDARVRLNSVCQFI